MKPYLDLYNLKEDERIELIRSLCQQGQKVAIMLENEKLAPGKIARYVQKLKEHGVVELGRADGPVTNVVTISFGVLPS